MSRLSPCFPMFPPMFPPGVSPNGVDAANTCGGEDNISTYFWYNWTTANSGIATVDSEGNHTGVAAGSTTSSTWGVIASYAPRSCPVIRQGPGPGGDNVQVPTSLKVLSVTVLQTGNSGNHGCLSGYYGIQVDVAYQVLDGGNPPQPIKNATMTPTEHVVWWDGTITDGDIGPTYVSTTSKMTRADGTFDDAPLGACKAIPFTSPLPTSQDISILLSNGSSYKVRHNSFEFSSTNLINHGTVTNGGEIKATQ